MMKREIKFRAWLFGKMGEPFNPFDPVFMASDGTFPDETIIMQYTGLKDKNGKEIYEGDIIEYTTYWKMGHKTSSKLFDVIFEDARFQLRYLSNNNRVGDMMNVLVNGIVIGNIYENPELFK